MEQVLKAFAQMGARVEAQQVRLLEMARLRRDVVCCARARFIFVALNKEGRVREMPQWTPRTDHERTLEAHARKRYELKKKKRVAKKSANGSG